MQLRSSIGFVLMGGAMLILLGCPPVMTSGNQAIKNESVMSQIKPVITDKATVYRLLGPPMSATNPPSGEAWMYHYSEVNRKFQIIGWGGLFDSTIDSQSTMVQITFDNRDLVKTITGRPVSSYSAVIPRNDLPKSSDNRNLSNKRQSISENIKVKDSMQQKEGKLRDYQSDRTEPLKDHKVDSGGCEPVL
jgi:outer membrane protein assembly factor BamE (lipoprotein component of BamABCDE complex)